MMPQTIKRLDILAGTPACALLTALHWITRLLHIHKPEAPRKIVFIKLIEMGSTILACPAFEEAQRLVGPENTYFLSFRQNSQILDALPFFPTSRIIGIDDSSLFRFLKTLFSALLHIRREGINTAIDMEGLTRSSAVITYLTGARNRVGYHNFTSEGPYRGRLFTHELSYNFQHHTSLMFLALVRALQAPRNQIPMLKESLPLAALAIPRFTPTPEESHYIQELLNPILQKASHPRMVILNPNCNDLLPLRRWENTRFVELGKRILEQFPDTAILITGSEPEQSAAEQMVTQLNAGPRALSVAGRTSIRQLLTLYTMASVLVSNDSGPCHFASLTPIRIVALFGPETPLLYGPLGPHAVSISANLACSPCVNMLNHRFSPCTDNACMKAISVEQVLQAVTHAFAAP